MGSEESLTHLLLPRDSSLSFWHTYTKDYVLPLIHVRQGDKPLQIVATITFPELCATQCAESSFVEGADIQAALEDTMTATVALVAMDRPAVTRRIEHKFKKRWVPALYHKATCTIDKISDGGVRYSLTCEVRDLHGAVVCRSTAERADIGKAIEQRHQKEQDARSQSSHTKVNCTQLESQQIPVESHVNSFVINELAESSVGVPQSVYSMSTHASKHLETAYPSNVFNFSGSELRGSKDMLQIDYNVARDYVFPALHVHTSPVHSRTVSAVAFPGNAEGFVEGAPVMAAVESAATATLLRTGGSKIFLTREITHKFIKQLIPLQCYEVTCTIDKFSDDFARYWLICELRELSGALVCRSKMERADVERVLELWQEKEEDARRDAANQSRHANVKPMHLELEVSVSGARSGLKKASNVPLDVKKHQGGDLRGSYAISTPHPTWTGQWEALGKSGLIVRHGAPLSSSPIQKCSMQGQSVNHRLKPGAIVRIVGCVGLRVNYRLVNGEGPEEGWVSAVVDGMPRFGPHSDKTTRNRSADSSCDNFCAEVPWVEQNAVHSSRIDGTSAPSASCTNIAGKSGPPLVSLLCVSNRGCEYMHRVVEQAWGQSHRPLQLVVLHNLYDFEKDSSEMVSARAYLQGWCNRAGDSFQVLFLPVTKSNEDSGHTLGHLRNAALDACTGEYVTIWDDDDLYHKHRVRQQLTEIQSYLSHGCTACTFRSILICETGGSKQLYQSPKRDCGWEGTLCCRRDSFPKYSHLDIGEDTPVLEQLVRRKCLIVIDEESRYIYVRHNSNTTNGSDELQKEWWLHKWATLPPRYVLDIATNLGIFTRAMYASILRIPEHDGWDPTQLEQRKSLTGKAS